MTAPRKTAAKKAPAKKAGAAARREVSRQDAKPIEVAFRGEKFLIPVARFVSTRFQGKRKHYAMWPNQDTAIEMVFELLGQVDSARFIDLGKPDEQFEEAATDFFKAIGKATNVPN